MNKSVEGHTNVEHVASKKFRLQDSQYRFPYHHLPEIHGDGRASRHRVLGWGFEYLCYLHHASEIAESFNPKSILEIGCGDGRFIGMTGDCSLRRVGVDLSERAIRFAKAFHPDIEFGSHGAEELEELFDVVAAIEVLEHIPDNAIPHFLKTLSDCLASKGSAIISVPTIVKRLNRKHYRHYDLDLLEKQIRRSGAPLKISNVDYVYRKSRLIALYNRLTITRWFTIEIGFLNRWVWRYIWKQLRRAESHNGEHLIAVLHNATDNT